MSDDPVTYSALSPDEQAALSLWIEGAEEHIRIEGMTAIKRTLAETPVRLRASLFTQLVPLLIEEHRVRHGRTPTLHELRLANPDLSAELTAVYPRLPVSYRLPVELHGYRVTQVVGDGGQAVVLRAQDDVHSTVAIKLSTSARHNELLLRERRLLGECNHPGIISVIGSGMQEDRAYYVMPYLRGMTLADKYASHRPEASEVVRLGAELCSIVDHLHRQGILHRDIKPANVWIDDHGAVKLIDLGMAVERSRWGEPLPPIQEFHGTPAFMSPEQAASDGQQDGELSDVFSIGATLYWLGTGSPPFDGGSGESVLSKAAACQYDQDQLQAVTNWPRPLLRACLAAMAADPAKRTASAADLADALHVSTNRSTTLSIGKSKSIAAILMLLLLTGLGIASLPKGLDPLVTASPEKKRGVDPVAEEPAKPPWIDIVSDTFDIDLAAIQADDFAVTARSLMRLVEPWGEQQRGPSAQPELAVRIPEQLLGIVKAIECRVGDYAWNKLGPTHDANTFVMPLDPIAAGSHGPVEIRIASEQSGGSGTAVGPFRYDIKVSQALRDDADLFGAELLNGAATAKCFEDTPTGWVVREDYSKRYTPLIFNMSFRSKQEAPMTSVGLELKKLRDDNPEDPKFQHQQIREYFRLVSKDIQSSNRLWVKIDFHNGVSRGPFLIEKPPSAQQERQQRVNAWFDQLDSDSECARYSYSKFVLTRLNEVLPDLSHLHFVGEYPVYGSSEGFHMADSAELIVDLKQLTRDRVLSLPPVWIRTTVRGRLIGGGFTPTFEIRNDDSPCGCGVAPVAASPGQPKLETYLYIERDAYPDASLSILTLLEDARAFQRDTIEACKRTRLLLSPMRPAGAVSVKHYTDREFKTPMETVRLGVVYARYFNAEGEGVGYSAYRLTPELLQEWTEHALWHVAGPVDVERMQKEKKVTPRPKELPQRGR
ncbi:serine/threonine-protein kinase [Adhaeretor mobilis]|uniref:Serine/threonine-protein kinase PrkC n=1 Tax=Adhaeretor mobilis TaxID=1930276 RepID=A0A517MQB0_9BACT|nr:serine/threonine-protein kinase [Adhaeretor mobilis]QDS97075.1 Serine/threonine-protein kinase PrkC [Adhaeretor mobilis]